MPAIVFKALNSIDLFTLVIYDLPAIQSICFPFFISAFGLTSLPSLFLIPLQTWRRASLVTPWAPAQSMLHMAYRVANYNLKWLLMHCRIGEHHNCSSMGHSECPARAGIKAPCCAVLDEQHSLFLFHLFAFIWFWKWENVQFVAVSILSIYLLFFRHTYIYINAIYI